MTKWQPIETAPKNGTRIICYIHRVEICYYRGDFWQIEGNPIVDPTHWMPLPEAPEK